MKTASVKRWSGFHKAVFRLSGGLIGRRLVDNDILLLTTTGHATGRTHTVPLLYLRDGDRLVLIASYGGRPRHPSWYRNLTAHPEVRVQIGGERKPMTASTATEVDRREWWPRVVEAYSDYAVYQSRTDRVIPLVFLEPLDQREHQTG